MHSARDDRPFYALAALAGLVLVAFLVPTSRAWALDAVIGPLRAQADLAPGLAAGYTIPSLFAWAFVGAVFAWVAYEIVFVRARFAPDRAFFLALAPALLFGPLFHAALVVRALPLGTPIAYAAAEPVVYVSAALVAGVGLALGRVTRRPIAAPLAWGALALAPLAWVLAPEAGAGGARRALLLLALAAGSALILAYAYARLRAGEPLDAALAVIGAHALDGATTWMVLRDPFGFGFEGFGERNPVSLALVSLGNGWPYFALKLALPLVLLSMVKRDPDDDVRLRAFLLFAIFVLGFGPGMSNLLQVLFS